MHFMGAHSGHFGSSGLVIVVEVIPQFLPARPHPLLTGAFSAPGLAHGPNPLLTVEVIDPCVISFQKIPVGVIKPTRLPIV